MDLRLNAMSRSINLSVYRVFDLQAGRFKFLSLERSKRSFPPLTPSYNASSGRGFEIFQKIAAKFPTPGKNVRSNITDNPHHGK